jgi:UDP-N-acetylglucosamine acyltransferase
MAKIHPLATVSPDAKLGENVEVGPYAFIDANVEIGDNSKIHPHATIYPYVRMGRDCQVFPGAVVGAIPQDLKFDGEVTYVEIGDRVTIRECATINRGTRASGKGVTSVGDDTLVMSYVHIAHDCRVGKHCILVSYVGIAGETDVDDWAIIGGNTAVHQFSHIGTHAMVGGCSAVNKDIPPYSICGRTPICYAGINIVGLRRRGFSTDIIRNIKDIYDTIYYQGYNISDGCAKVEAGFPQSEERDAILSFIRNSKRGIVRAMEVGVKGAIE